MASSVPSSRHLANRAYTDCQGPYASGISRHCAPLRATQSIPLSMFRSSFRGRPRFPDLSAGSSFFTRSHCSFVNSYRFMALFSHFYLICAIFIFQTSPSQCFVRPHQLRHTLALRSPRIGKSLYHMTGYGIMGEQRIFALLYTPERTECHSQESLPVFVIGEYLYIVQSPIRECRD